MEPATIERWAVVNFSARCDVRGLIRDLTRIGESKGIVCSVTYPSCKFVFLDSMYDLAVFLFCFCRKLKLHLMYLKRVHKIGGPHLLLEWTRCLKTYNPNFLGLLNFSSVCFLRGRTVTYMVGLI